jgi:hypothetical protein
MPTSTELSTTPMERLKEFAQNVGLIAWDDPDRIERQIRNLCEPLEREPDVLMRAIREGVPSAVRRQWEREPDQPSEHNIKMIARHLCKRIDIDRDESMWAVRTIAVATGYVPLLPAAEMSSAPSARTDAPQGYSFQSQQPATGRSIGLTEIEKKELASAQSQAGFIELPGGGADPSGSYSGPINTNRPYPGPINTTLPSERNQQAGSYPGPINTTLPSEAAARPHPVPINLTLPSDAARAAQQNSPYGAAQPYGQAPLAPAGPPLAPGQSLAGQPMQSYWPESIIPDEVDGNTFSWAAFLGGIWWGYFHGMRLRRGAGWIVGVIVPTLAIGYFHLWYLLFLPWLGFHVVMGLRGNSLGWSYRQFNTTEHFRKVQKAWLIAGVFIFLLESIGMVDRTLAMRQEAIFMSQIQSGDFSDDGSDAGSGPGSISPVSPGATTTQQPAGRVPTAAPPTSAP